MKFIFNDCDQNLMGMSADQNIMIMNADQPVDEWNISRNGSACQIWESTVLVSHINGRPENHNNNLFITILEHLASSFSS